MNIEEIHRESIRMKGENKRLLQSLESMHAVCEQAEEEPAKAAIYVGQIKAMIAEAVKEA